MSEHTWAFVELNLSLALRNLLIPLYRQMRRKLYAAVKTQEEKRQIVNIIIDIRQKLPNRLTGVRGGSAETPRLDNR